MFKQEVKLKKDVHIITYINWKPYWYIKYNGKWIYKDLSDVSIYEYVSNL